MSKGFSAHKNPRIDKFIVRLSKALKSRDRDRIEASLMWGFNNLGEKVMGNIMLEIYRKSSLLDIDKEDADFFWEWKTDLLKTYGGM
ncbi:MAG: hypothetical protein RLZZ490_2092 [Cyanobacteriota bacterium]|jgi:hypothetical protein